MIGVFMSHYNIGMYDEIVGNYDYNNATNTDLYKLTS